MSIIKQVVIRIIIYFDEKTLLFSTVDVGSFQSKTGSVTAKLHRLKPRNKVPPASPLHVSSSSLQRVITAHINLKADCEP